MTRHRFTGSGFRFTAARRKTHAQPYRPRLEMLEDRTVPAVVSIDATSAIRNVNDRVLGANLTWWDTQVATDATVQMVQDAGLRLFRQPGGSSADTFHFDAGPRFSGASTVAAFNALTEAAGGDGMPTINYGTGSPQEGAAYLAYCNAAVGDPTVLGVGLQWSDASQSWVPRDWQTAGYWANLRAATPITPDDGFNHLRVGHTAPFGWHYVEVGNEEYGSWETDRHALDHDPATYVQFAKDFTNLARQFNPAILVGLDVGGTQGNYGSRGGNWAHEILNQCALQGYVPDYLSDHNYMFDPGHENDATLLLHSVNDPSFTGYGGPENWAGRSQAYRALLQQYLGGLGDGVQLLCTEFNSVSSNPSNQTTSLVNGLWVADALGGILETEYNAAIIWDLRNSYDTAHYNPNLYGWRTGGDYGLIGSPGNVNPPATGAYVPYPTYFAEQLFSHLAHNGDTVIRAASDDLNLAVYATTQANGHLALFVINKSPTATLAGNFTLTGFASNHRAMVWQYGVAEDNAQSRTTDGHASLTNFRTRLAMTGTSTFIYSFPAYSMTVLDLAPAPTPSLAGFVRIADFQPPTPGPAEGDSDAPTNAQALPRASNMPLESVRDLWARTDGAVVETEANRTSAAHAPSEDAESEADVTDLLLLVSHFRF